MRALPGRSSPAPAGGRTFWSVAAGILAATLAFAHCDAPERSARGEGSAAAAQERAVTAHWLIAPEPSQSPPLTAPVDIAVDAERGRLYLLELKPPTVRVYALTDGAYLASLGREGDGPGEYRYPASIALGRSGEVAVLTLSGRVTFWAPDGSLTGVVQSGGGLATDILQARADSFYVKVDVFPPEDVAEFRIVTRDSALTTARFNDAELPGTEVPGRATRNHAYPVAGTIAGELLVATPGPEYRIVRVGPDGRLREPIERDELAPLRRSESEIEAIRQRVREGFSAAGRAPPATIPVGANRPHLARLAAAPDGTIWALTQRGDDSASVIDYFEPDGRFAGSLRVEVRAVDLAVTSRSVYLLARGDLDMAGVAVVARPVSAGVRRSAP